MAMPSNGYHVSLTELNLVSESDELGTLGIALREFRYAFIIPASNYSNHFYCMDVFSSRFSDDLAGIIQNAAQSSSMHSCYCRICK